jgi:hypothetical protein
MAIINGVGRVGIRVTSGSSPAPSYLLDTYSGAAVAYSLRKLSSTYSGSAIRVRRSSDNTEMNIGFNSDGSLNTSALLTFVGVGNGFVTTWYDQSGNNVNANQTVAASQPLIVNSGILNVVNGKPSVYFNNKFLNMNFSSVNNQTYFTVTKFNSVGAYFSRIFGPGGGMHQLYQHSNSKYVMYNGGSGLFSTMNTDTNQKVIGTYWNTGSTSKLYFNGVLNATGNSGSYTATTTTLGSNQTTALEVQEHLSWQLDYTSNMLALSTNQKNYYGF